MRRHPGFLFACMLLCLMAGCKYFPNPSSNKQSAGPIGQTEFHSANGRLAVTLVASEQEVDLGPAKIPAIVYNGYYGGPKLFVRPGDRVEITLVNHLKEPTNLHYHGLEASPLANGDNMHISVPPGQSFLYELTVPKHQPPGLYWYHAHIHGLSERQVGGGLAGPFMVEGFADQFPELTGITEQLLTLHEITFDDSPEPTIAGYFHNRVQTVNGELTTKISMRPGETQLWHISNTSANLYLKLAIPGHKFRIIGQDGGTKAHETVTEILRIRPAGRYEVLVDAGAAGSYPLISKFVPTGTGEARTLERPLSQLVVEGEPMAPIVPLANFPQSDDLRRLPLDARRSVLFSQKSDNSEYYVNGQKFDLERVDVRVPLGSIEEWTIRNDSDDLHVFHIHQLHFQVSEIDGVAVEPDGYVDNVDVPEHSSVKVLIPFTHPEILGQFMFHCHILEHEDRGMMAQLEVYDPAAPRQSALQRWLAARFNPAPQSLLGTICRVRAS